MGYYLSFALFVSFLLLMHSLWENKRLKSPALLILIPAILIYIGICAFEFMPRSQVWRPQEFESTSFRKLLYFLMPVVNFAMLVWATLSYKKKPSPKMSAVQPPSTQESKAMSERRGVSPGVAAIISFFIPGLGQIAQARIGTGLLFLILVPLGYFLFIVPGLLLHLWCVINAANYKG